MLKGFAPLALLAASLILALGWLMGRTGGIDVAPSQSYKADLAEFHGRHLALMAAHGTGQSVDGIPVVRPPAGSDIPVLAKRWEFSPALQLEPGKTYHLHLLAEDAVHSAAIGEAELLLRPGEVQVVDLTAPMSGRVRLQCAEYCGLGHTKMIGSIEVAP
ncbi:Cytochrome c oxidase (B(O/a)3-type) chain II [Paramagnetospirillum magnetotacticum MS-1]|uniref:Cytochrome c oxidase (B(O/a)3-type) chain II n=1 Tax=Paramagnetospirillum magnetotacticum MS-1 TaxID=272627 RepID=A0A0C2YVG5_PARME|nr:quinol oxidase [Paramagnetospirillum magnetotacticum]KIL98695.1 Cytochrome c oxidase (B(O/a)3-type) chain II [Paramagnetospirillum magnetotacticum MS-1]